MANRVDLMQRGLSPLLFVICMILLTHVGLRGRRKIEKYQDLGRELQMIWNVKVKIIPLAVGSLGAIPKLFGNRLKQIGITVGTAQVQKTVLLGTARILRKVLKI